MATCGCHTADVTASNLVREVERGANPRRSWRAAIGDDQQRAVTTRLCRLGTRQHADVSPEAPNRRIRRGKISPARTSH